MNITLNGLDESVIDRITVSALVSARSIPVVGIAIAVNGEVVRSSSWPETLLADGDVVEIVTARQGG